MMMTREEIKELSNQILVDIISRAFAGTDTATRDNAKKVANYKLSVAMDDNVRRAITDAYSRFLNMPFSEICEIYYHENNFEPDEYDEDLYEEIQPEDSLFYADDKTKLRSIVDNFQKDQSYELTSEKGDKRKYRFMCLVHHLGAAFFYLQTMNENGEDDPMEECFFRLIKNYTIEKDRLVRERNKKTLELLIKKAERILKKGDQQ